MSTLQYKQSLGGNGVAQGLPIRRASQLYDVEPNIRYPNVLSTGLDSDLHTYDRGIYLRLPHLPVTFVVEPYISNHKNQAKGGTGNFTRRQYFVIKRGQPLMASTKREESIGLIDGSAVTYNDPAEWETDGKLAGYRNTTEDATYSLRDGHDAGDDPAPDETIDQAAFDALPASAPGEPSQDDYEPDVLTVAEFDELDDEAKKDYVAVYDPASLQDNNDKIPTGGTNKYAVVEEALFGSTGQIRYVEVDADVFFFGAATRSEGFIYPSTGGAERVVFFNEVDREAGVTLPAGEGLRVVQPLGNTVPTGSNTEAWENSALILPVRPTIGFAHTELEQALSHAFHLFQTGTDVHSPVRKGRLTIPYVNLTKLKEILDEKVPDMTFHFTNAEGNRTGIKVGAYGTEDVADMIAYSLLTDEDAGYANLYFNFAAPFLMSTRDLRLQDKVVPDLFGNFTLLGETFDGDEEAAAEAQSQHICGRVMNIYDTPRRYMLNLEVNPMFQSRIVDNTGVRNRNYLNEGYRRVRSADNAGMEPLLSDFLFMLLGGASYDWAAAMLPTYGGLPQDLAKVIEDIVLQGAAGLVEIAADTLV